MTSHPGRFRSSEVTFGPAGRVLITLALLVPPLVMLQGGIMGLVGVGIWVCVVLPRGLRDVWKDARRRVPQPHEVPAHLASPRPEAPVIERPSPPRW